MREAPYCVIAAGGTGGHMFPAQALAEALIGAGWRVRLSTDVRGARYAVGFPVEVNRDRVVSATPARGGLAEKAAVPFLLLAGVAQSLWRMVVDRPQVVVGFGGYPTIPAMVAAGVLRVPRMIHEQNGVLGRVNAALARRVNAVACGAWPTDLPAGVLGHHTGNPVRSAVRERTAAGYVAPGDFPMSVLVIGGSQGARILSDMVPDPHPRLPPALRANVRVSHQARQEDADRVQAFYDEHGIAAEVKPFFEDIARRITEAQLVISRAGASSVADIAVIGRPAILIPYAAAAGDHQTANARQLVDAEAATMIPEKALAPDTLASEVARILTNPQAADQMARNALGAGRPDATERLVEMVTGLKGQER